MPRRAATLLRSPPPWWAAAGAAIVVGGAALVATRSGAGITNDSVTYLVGAHELAAGHGYRDVAGQLVTDYAPGYAALLSLFVRAGADPVTGGVVVNALAAAGAVVLGWLLVRRHVRRPPVAWAATAWLAVSVPLLQVAHQVWTEPIFIVLTLVVVLALEEALSVGDRAWRWLAVAVVAGWAAFAVRYAGLVVVGAGALAVLLGGWRRGRVAAVLQAAGFAAAGAVVPVLWFAHNVATAGDAAGGDRSGSPDDLVTALSRTAGTVGSWVVPASGSAPATRAVGTVVVLAVLAAAVAALAHRRPGRRADGAPDGAATPEDGLDGPTAAADDGPSLLPLLCLVAAYVAFVGALQVLTASDPIDTRLLSPVAVPATVLVAVVADRVAALVPARRRHATAVVATGLFVLALAGQAVGFARTTRTLALTGDGYTRARWRTSAVAQAADQLPAGATIYSNQPGPLWLATGRRPVLPSPTRTRGSSTVALGPPTAFADAVACRPAFLVWFAEALPYDLTPDELAATVRLTSVATTADGTVYRVTADRPCR